jgi:uncharacterized protein (DUF849 family)
MTDEELIARLRKYKDDLLSITADRIETLVKERDQWVEHTKNAVWADSEELKLANARAERLEAALREIAGNNCITCSADACNALFAERNPRAALKGADHE